MNALCRIEARLVEARLVEARPVEARPVEAMLGAESFPTPRLVDPADPLYAGRLEAFVASHPKSSPFHRPAWLQAVARATGHHAFALIAEVQGDIVAYVPLVMVCSPWFGRMLASSGFAVDGGLLLAGNQHCATMPEPIITALEELAARLSCPTIELRGGSLPADRIGWSTRHEAHAGFVRALAAHDEAELAAIPRKQRAEVRKSLANDFSIEIGHDRANRDAHYHVYATSVRNLGTPVFPRRLFEAVLDDLPETSDILTLRHQSVPVASVLSLYYHGTVMPYWGGGTLAARGLRANDRMYFELMRHARTRGCTHFDFGRSKTGSGAWHFKRNWGFEPVPLAYGVWTAPGSDARDADPTSAAHARAIALWKRLPLKLANAIGPMIARGLG